MLPIGSIQAISAPYCMKKHLLILSFLLLISTTGFSQIFVDQSYKRVESRLQRDFKNDKVIVTKTDTTIIYLLRDSTFSPMDLYCSFDAKKNCFFQKLSFDCDSCYHKFTKQILAAKAFNWQNISPEHYVSNYYEHLLLVTDDKNRFYTITLVHYTRDEYKQLFTKKQPDKNKPEVYY
jgi:hypothetical protein